VIEEDEYENGKTTDQSASETHFCNFVAGAKEMKIVIANWSESDEKPETDLERSFDFNLFLSADISKNETVEKDWWNGYSESEDIWAYPTENEFIVFLNETNGVICSQIDGGTPIFDNFSVESINSDVGEPKDFNEAMFGPEFDKWLPSGFNEIMNFIKRKVWKKYLRSELPDGKRPLGTKWVFKKKNEQDNSIRYKSRLVIKGFTQIPGVDFTQSFSPVATETTVRVTIAVQLYYSERKGWICEVVDIEAAFLNADLEKGSELFIEWPQGLYELGLVTREELEKYCLRCDKAMYGAVQASRAWFMTLLKVLIKMRMEQSEHDPCLWYRRNEKREVIVIVTTYVDDCMLIGTKENVESFKSDLKKFYKLTELGILKKHLGVWYEYGRDEHGLFLEASMRDYVKDAQKMFTDAVGRPARPAKTPGYPNTSLVKNTGDVIMKDEYRSLTGKIMYFVKKIRPEAANAARELASHMDSPGEAHWKAMERIFGYLQDETTAAIKFRDPKFLKARTMVDSNWSTNQDDRKSVSGELDFIGECLAAWWSQGQATNALSSTEAEYYSLSKGSQNNRFSQMLLYEITMMMIRGEIWEDNTGCIFLATNQQTSNRTKHVDNRHHFVRYLLRNGFQVLRFVRSEDNASDICTKNVTEAIHAKFSPLITNGLLGKFVTEIANREAVGNSGALTKDDIIQGARAFPERASSSGKTNRVSNPGNFKQYLAANRKPKSKEIRNSLAELDLG